MSAPMKKHRISLVRYVSHGSKKQEKNIPWREAFKKGIQEFSEAGLLLRGARYKAELTQKALADQIHVKTHHISEMEHGKRPIGKTMAKRLAGVFKMDYRIFL